MKWINSLNGKLKYMKAYIALVATFLSSLSVALMDGQVTGAEWISIISATLAVPGVVAIGPANRISDAIIALLNKNN